MAVFQNLMPALKIYNLRAFTALAVIFGTQPVYIPLFKIIINNKYKKEAYVRFIGNRTWICDTTVIQRDSKWAKNSYSTAGAGESNILQPVYVIYRGKSKSAGVKNTGMRTRVGPTDSPSMVDTPLPTHFCASFRTPIIRIST